MDQMLLTGLVSCRFSSLAEGSPVGDWVTAPRLKFVFACKGKLSETRASESKGSPTASGFGSTLGASVARTTDTTDKIPATRTVNPKTI
jgi:hypothetical protein